MRLGNDSRLDGSPEGLAGVGRLHELLAAFVDQPEEVVVGIETDRGLWVQALIAARYQVYAINPMGAARYRDRHQVSGAKSDAGDAKVLADLVGTDRHNHRVAAGDSPEVDAVKVLARGHQNLIWARTRHPNQLRNALLEYYPAVDAFDNLADRDALAVLDHALDPATGARLSISQLRAVLRRGGRVRNLDQRAADIQAALRGHQLAADPAMVQVFTATTKAAAAIISELNRQIAELETTLADRFEHHPDADIYLPARTRCCARRPGARRVRGRPEPLRQRQVSQELRRNVTSHGCLGPQTRCARPPRRRPTPIRRHRPVGVLLADQ